MPRVPRRPWPEFEIVGGPAGYCDSNGRRCPDRTSPSMLPLFVFRLPIAVVTNPLALACVARSNSPQSTRFRNSKAGFGIPFPMLRLSSYSESRSDLVQIR